jgi:Na+/H+ antiporter NhaC
MAATIGAVLAGAVFGDHCSPISDTTVVSAFSCACDVMAHVRTQLPYALTAAAVAVLLGYGPAGFGVTPWLLLPVGGAVLWALVRLVGKR